MPQPVNPQKTIHLWFPDIFEFKGGIQVYSAFLLQALQALFPDWQYQVFLKHDRYAATELPFDCSTIQFHCAGNLPRSLRTAGFAFQLAWHGFHQQPDLILSTHVNFTPVARWLKQVRGIPYWAVAHGVDAWDIRSPLLKQALQAADRILSVSNYTRQRLLASQPLDPSKISLLPNTVDAKRFKPGPKPVRLLQRHCLHPHQPIILTVSRLTQADGYKGYEHIVRALPFLQTYFADIRYIIVGKGDDLPRLRALARSQQVEDSVIFTGFVPDTELVDYYNLCDVFAMPSKGEGFGIVYLEALACGKPTLGGNQDGAIDALDRGRLGILVPPDNGEAIARSLLSILQQTYEHPLLYSSQALRAATIERYGFEQFQQCLQQLILDFFMNTAPTPFP